MVSTTVEYAMTVMIGFLLLTTGVAATGGILEERDDEVTEKHLQHVGAEVSTIMTHHSEMSDAHDEHSAAMSTVGVTGGTTYESSTVVDEPPEINGDRYTVQVAPSGDKLVLTTADVGVVTTVPINDAVNAEPLSGGVGGRLVVVYDESTDQVSLESESVQL